MATARQILARLKKLLLTRDLELITQGVELVAALDDPAIWGALLDGVDWVPPDGSALGSFVPNATFRIPKASPSRPYRELALALLVANAPLSLRERVTSLALQPGAETAPPLISSLREYPNLRALDLRIQGDLELAPLADAPSLEVLRIRGYGEISLEGLGRAPRLRRLEVSVMFRTTAGIEGAPLESVVLRSGVLQDLRGLERTPVRHAEVAGAPQLDLSSLGRAPRLESLRLEADEIDLAGLAGSPLRTLLLQTRSPTALPSLPNLETLTVTGLRHPTRKTPLSPAPTFSSAAVPSLRRVALDHVVTHDLEGLRGSGIERLVLRGCWITDLGALGALDRLQELCLVGTGTQQLGELPPAALIDPEGQTVDQLDLSGTRIPSIRGIGRLRGLRILALQDCRELESLEGIEGSAIAVLDLRGCGRLDPAPLARLPELRLVAIYGSGIRPGDVDPAIAPAVSLEERPDLRAALDRPPVRGR